MSANSIDRLFIFCKKKRAPVKPSVLEFTLKFSLFKCKKFHDKPTSAKKALWFVISAMNMCLIHIHLDICPNNIFYKFNMR